MKSRQNLNDISVSLIDDKVCKRVAVVCASDECTQRAVAKAICQGWIKAVFVGSTKEIQQNEELKSLSQSITLVEANNDVDAAEKAVALVKEGDVDVLMKGLLNTDTLLHAVLNKEKGILPKGNILTHIAVTSIPTYYKLLFFTDAAVIPYPTQEQRFMQIKYVTAMCRKMGILEPKVALIHCSEKVNEKHFPFTAGYKELIADAKKGAFGRCMVDGPLDLKTACNLHSMQNKHINSPLQGDADAVILPDIESGNVFYKSITTFAQAEVAGILQGTSAPVVLTSRGDNFTSKFNSLALACRIV